MIFIVPQKIIMLINVENKIIGENNPVFVIAEAGVNHNGSIENGIKLIDIACDAGADAVKFQTFKAEEINTINAPKSSYHIKTTGTDSNQSWFEMRFKAADTVRNFFENGIILNKITE